MLILAALREHKIEIPYPQRVMHMVGAAVSRTEEV
jgi:small-conductance mechanosensitive channel